MTQHLHEEEQLAPEYVIRLVQLMEELAGRATFGERVSTIVDDYRVALAAGVPALVESGRFASVAVVNPNSFPLYIGRSKNDCAPGNELVSIPPASWIVLPLRARQLALLAGSITGAPTQVPVEADAQGAATALTATLPGAPSTTTYLTGFEVTGTGATAASVIAVTVTGALGGTETYELAIPAGAAAPVQPLIVELENPLPASGPNQAIAVNVPSFGAGNTNAAVVAHGYQQDPTLGAGPVHVITFATAQPFAAGSLGASWAD